ncbi:DUF6000 family protein [Streptomyces globisporus]|uniref:DUF6000 family protein n=1 Tax=Streptomyces globisporus TaxID=1908 RepID=UPI00366307D4
MPFQHPEEIGYGYVIERYVTRKDSGGPRYRDLKSRHVLRPGRPHAELLARQLIDDAAAITDAELAALLGFEWRSRLTAAWLIGVGRRDAFRERIGDLLLASEVCHSGGACCFALARFGNHVDAEILTAYLDRYLPRTDLRDDQPAALGALLRLDAHLGTHQAAPFTQPDGLWDQWVNALPHLRDHPLTPPPSSAAGWTSSATSPTAGQAFDGELAITDKLHRCRKLRSARRSPLVAALCHTPMTARPRCHAAWRPKPHSPTALLPSAHDRRVPSATRECPYD